MNCLLKTNTSGFTATKAHVDVDCYHSSTEKSCSTITAKSNFLFSTKTITADLTIPVNDAFDGISANCPLKNCHLTYLKSGKYVAYVATNTMKGAVLGAAGLAFTYTGYLPMGDANKITYRVDCSLSKNSHPMEITVCNLEGLTSFTAVSLAADT